MDDKLIGYLLNSLDSQEHRQVQEYLATNPEAGRKLELLQQALDPLAADRVEATPPPGLVIRTIGKVAEYCARERELPHAPPISRTPTISRPLWRRVDFLVAASLLLLASGLGIPALLHLRTPQNVIDCQNNLREFFGALTTYHDQKKKFPDIAAEAPHHVAGLVVPLLMDAEVWPTAASIRCPGNGPTMACSHSLAQLKAMNPDEFKQVAPRLMPGYAYSLGYVDESGGYHCPQHDPRQPQSLLPLLADGPPASAGLGNSPNHGGNGQNVLFHDGHVRFTTLRTVGLDNDDIFTNQKKEVAAGLNWRDSVLGPSGASPFQK